jgi:hypothetical protein
MTHPIRSIFALTILAIVLVACGTTVGAPASEAPAPSEPATPSVQPSVEPSVEPEPSEPAQEERDIAGIITMAEMAFSGPGGTIQEALDNGPTGDEIPTLVNGVIFRDTDGKIYLATSISDVDAPSFDGPMLLVLNMPNDGPSWDMAYAEQNLLEEANGIVFRQDTQVLGFLELP